MKVLFQKKKKSPKSNSCNEVRVKEGVFRVKILNVDNNSSSNNNNYNSNNNKYNNKYYSNNKYNSNKEINRIIKTELKKKNKL
jgi:hypothetical protein